MNIIVLVVIVAIVAIVSIISTIYVVRYFDNQTRDRVPKLRRDLCETFTEYGMETEVKDELLYVLRNGTRLRLRFYNSYGGIITLFIESLINLEKFNIDEVGELVIERRFNNEFTFGKVRFADRKLLEIQHQVLVKRVEHVMNALKIYDDLINSIYEDLYSNKEQLEARFGEKIKQDERKIGFK